MQAQLSVEEYVMYQQEKLLGSVYMWLNMQVISKQVMRHVFIMFHLNVF